MITPDDNNDDNGYGRLKRWREKHRGLVNLRQREYRKKKGGDVPCPTIHIQEIRQESNAAPIVQSSGAAETPIKESTIARRTVLEDLRAQVANVSQEPAVEHAPSKPLVFRNDYGNIITERQWNLLQKKKEEAKADGYVIDEYSQ